MYPARGYKLEIGLRAIARLCKQADDKADTVLLDVYEIGWRANPESPRCKTMMDKLTTNTPGKITNGGKPLPSPQLINRTKAG